MATGFIHSIESMGLVDGPGIRSVVFMQGCRLRCRYCHNPDTWDRAAASAQITPQQLVRKISRFKPYFGEDGGVTFSGGEPLLQPEFLAEAMELCHQEGIRTCLDTAGAGDGDYERILKSADLILLDIKHYTEEGYRQITGQDRKAFDQFREAVRQAGTPLWLRHVVVPGLTDGEAHRKGLAEYMAGFPNVQKIELLPYHVLGRSKYRTMGLPYPLEGVPPMDREQTEEWQKQLNQQIVIKR